jgi:cytosine/adenosine deaminase-related metal-dependent hydrolase
LQAERTLVRGGWYFDAIQGVMRRNPGILILNGKFYQVGGVFAPFDLAEAQIVQLADDEYALPGLIDMHAHYDMMLMSTPQVERRVDELKGNPIVYLANGVTSTYTAGEYDPEAVREARLRIDRGEQIGPRIFQAGPKFGKASPRWNVEATPDQVRQLVDQWAQLGVVSFKAYGLRRDQLQVLIQRAHQHGLTVTCHLMGRDDINPQEAVLMGIDRVEHYMGGDDFDPDQTAYASLPRLNPDSAASGRSWGCSSSTMCTSIRRSTGSLSWHRMRSRSGS